MGRDWRYWADKYSLPLHLYYGRQIRANLRAFKQVLAEHYPKSSVRYAVKALPHPEVLKIVNEEECGVDAASFNEMKCAAEAGIPPEKIDLNGNCKTDALIKEGVGKDMLLVADSFEELKIIHETARAMDRKPRVLLRISGYDVQNVTASSVFTAGKWTKFGAPLEDIPAFINSLENYPNLRFIGFHTHIGSQITELEPYVVVMGKLLELARLLKRKGRECEIINIGGGYPVSYVGRDEWKTFVNDVGRGILESERGQKDDVMIWDEAPVGFKKKLDVNFVPSDWEGERFYSKYPKEKMLDALLKSDVKVFEETHNAVKALKAADSPELVVEPGRSIAEDCGVTLIKTGHVRKVAGGHNLTTVEMGIMSHCDSLIEASLRRWEIVNEINRTAMEPFYTFIAGNLCFSGDMISKFKVPLQRRPLRGEVLMMYDTGAYCSWFMASNANSFPRPARVLVKDDDNAVLMKHRDSYEELFR